MNLGLEGKTALVLGAGGGLGSAIAKCLAGEGVKVAAADLDEGSVSQTSREIGKFGGKCSPFSWDIKDPSASRENIARIEEAFGPVDILVNNTGGPPPTSAAGQAPELWLSHFQSMVTSVIAIADIVLPGMRERKWGRIVTSTSSGVIQPISNLAISNSLRLSLVGWSKTLAAEVGRDGVTVNVVVPGRIATRRILFLDEKRAEREGTTPEAVAAASTASIPVGRYGKPEEYADAVTFLASQRASYVTGSILRVDGGLIAGI